MDREIIKKEGKDLIDEGYSSSEVLRYLFSQYGTEFQSYRHFENSFGKFFRKLMHERDQNKGKKTVAFKKSKATTTTPPPITSALNNKILPMYKEEFKIKRTGDIGAEIQIEAPVKDEKLYTEEKILREAGFDPEIFCLKAVRRSKWQAQTKDQGIIDMFSLRVNAELKGPNEIDYEKVFSNLSLNLKRPITNGPVKFVENGKVAIVAIADLHLGKYSDPTYTGIESNSPKTEREYYNMLNQAIGFLKERPVEKIIFFWSQDFFHYDSKEKTTTAGTRQDTDISCQGLFEKGLEMLVKGICMLSEIAPVKTFYTKSNHDEETGFKAAIALKYIFAFDENVDMEIGSENGSLSRHYEAFGKNLFGFGHGDKEKKRIDYLMSTEYSQEWGGKVNREFFLGHFHSLKEYESGGVTIRYLRSPSSGDEWHKDSGYVGAQRMGHLFIRDAEWGEDLYKPLHPEKTPLKVFSSEKAEKYQNSFKEVA